jgi:hypothetical protein
LGTKCGQIEAETSLFRPLFAGLNPFRHLAIAVGDGFISMPNPEAQDIDGIGKQPIRSMSKRVTDNRPDNAAMEVIDNYIVITIPALVTREQVRQIIDIANKALRAVGPGEFGDTASARVEPIHPKDQVEVGDIEF